MAGESPAVAGAGPDATPAAISHANGSHQDGPHELMKSVIREGEALENDGPTQVFSTTRPGLRRASFDNGDMEGVPAEVRRRSQARLPRHAVHLLDEVRASWPRVLAAPAPGWGASPGRA